MDLKDKSDRREQMFLKLFLKPSPDQVTDEEIAYFRQHPDQIDEVSAPVTVHKLFLWAGAILGVAGVALSKVLKYLDMIFMSEFVREFIIDLVFESGVALIGAAVTAYLLGILLNRQQDNAARWRSVIRSRISDSED
jgi:hypothetical protein